MYLLLDAEVKLLSFDDNLPAKSERPDFRFPPLLIILGVLLNLYFPPLPKTVGVSCLVVACLVVGVSCFVVSVSCLVEGVAFLEEGVVCLVVGVVSGVVSLSFCLFSGVISLRVKYDTCYAKNI